LVGHYDGQTCKFHSGRLLRVFVLVKEKVAAHRHISQSVGYSLSIILRIERTAIAIWTVNTEVFYV